MARNGVHSGGRTKAEYYKVWDLETGVYKGVWNIGKKKKKMPSLFRYERLSADKEEEYNKLRKQSQIKKAYEKQNLGRYDDYLK